MTEKEIESMVRLNAACDHITFLVDYARRVATGAVTKHDAARVQDARVFVALIKDKGEPNNG